MSQSIVFDARREEELLRERRQHLIEVSLKRALREADDLIAWFLPLFNIGPLGGFEPAVRSHEARMQARKVEEVR